MPSPRDTAPPPRLQFVAPSSPRWTRLAAALVEQGCEVVRTSDALAADLAGADLVLIDLSGLERERDVELAKLARSRGAALVALLPSGDRDALERAYALGAVDFLDDACDVRTAAEHLRFTLQAVRRRASAESSAGDERDRLTGLPTRASFLRHVTAALGRARESQRCLAVLCLDLDRFKQIAGSLRAGELDELVLAAARRFRETCRHNDVLSRLGLSLGEGGLARVSGEAFTLLVEKLTHVEDAAKVARRMIDALRAPFSVAGQEISLSMTVGIASFPAEGADAETLLQSAETAAYCAKQSGANSLQFHSPGMTERAFERLTLETSLRHALERDELVLHYQPRVAIATGRTVGMEALVRWRHPQLGLVSPAQFVPIAEESGLIVPLGEWVLRTACEQCRQWRERGHTGFKVSVNLAPAQFRQPDLFASVVRTLSVSGLDPRCLELELTESSLMQDFEAVVATLRRFKELGVGVSVDDFGTGYSSLSYLRRLPLDALKIDRSFLSEVTSNPEDASIVTAIVLMGKSLKLRLVAEGVETPGQLAFLRIMQCDEAQGFLFSRPLPAEQIERWLAVPCGAAA